MTQFAPANEILRLPSPAPAPQALTFDGEALWMTSWETQRLYGIQPQRFTVFEEIDAPGRPIGMVAVGDELRVVCSEEDDSRFIRRFVPGHGFKSERIACPDDTGSFLAFDGSRLWLSQRFNQRVLELDADYGVASELHVDAQIVGIVWIEDRLYLSTWHGKAGGCKIGRIDRASRAVEYVASLPFAGISLTHDGSRFWTNDHRGNAVVAFELRG
ncbi:MAG TPA: hypothetical protein VNG31_08030 [Candidatus Baltobacteraceae bacterium]|nr:hypothetical protein [Candidatus Dormibacteraeota bacterium]HVA34084.1 hypothetical protein [Candidatus Baltobacteraceae bacterium]